MKIVWDALKRNGNLAKHPGCDFATLTMAFFDAVDPQESYGGRLISTGEWQGEVITVIFRPLGEEAISIISMRQASSKERRAFYGH